MRKLILALLFLPAVVLGQTCPTAIPDPVPRDAMRLSWTAPTQNTDGSAITKAITYTIYEGTTAKCTTTATAASLTSLSVGVHSWTTTAKTTDGESAKSNVASKTITAAPPNPPTGLTVDPASLIAYTLVQSKDRIALVAVGHAAPGTACDSTQPVLGYWVIPIASVTLVGTVRPVVVVAGCT